LIFFTGIHNLAHANKVDYSFISINRLMKRKGDFHAKTWILDSGAFSQVITVGNHTLGTRKYAEQINRWSRCGILVRAVSQDYICIDTILEKLGRTVDEHQRMTITRYIRLIKLTEVPIMPVLQGNEPEEYAKHVSDYGSLLKEHAWVGVGSIARKNTNPALVLNVLNAIHEIRPDLRLHGFGIKKTCLQDSAIRDQLFSADSMAWNYAARYENRNPEDYKEALKFKNRIETMPVQINFL
tara:strand:- start:71 stop:790 length:720 start_codon:yes stop_codon:yes gene_type:complete